MNATMHPRLRCGMRGHRYDGAGRRAGAGRRLACSRASCSAPPGGRPGEVVFNTALTGYQEIITDPSYAGRSSRSPTRTSATTASTPPTSSRAGCSAAASSSASWPGGRATGAPRRDSTPCSPLRHPRHRRHRHPPPHPADPRHRRDPRRDRPGRPSSTTVGTRRGDEPGTDGIDLVAQVTTPEPYTVGGRRAGCRIVAYDFGIKRTILRHLAGLGTVEVVPASTPAAESLARDPDGVFLSTGRATRPRSPCADEIIGDCSAKDADVRHLPRPPVARPGARRRRP